MRLSFAEVFSKLGNYFYVILGSSRYLKFVLLKMQLKLPLTDCEPGLKNAVEAAFDGLRTSPRINMP